MSSLDENSPSANTIQMNQMQSLIIGRLIVCFLLLVTSWIWYSGYVELTFTDLPNNPDSGLFFTRTA